MLMQAVRDARPDLEVVASAEALDPACADIAPVLCLNYHRALHSRWTAEAILSYKARAGAKVVTIFHDTFGELEPDDLCLRLHDISDAFVVHEPCKGLSRALYWRQGVPCPPSLPSSHYVRTVGTIGHDFPWKNYDRLAEIARRCDWSVLYCVPFMPESRIRALKQINPRITVQQGADRTSVLAHLQSCDATAFLYTCANSGTSAAVRFGIGSCRPTIAFRTCRQFRDLLQDPLGSVAIRWAETFEDVGTLLSDLPSCPGRDTPTYDLARQDQWSCLGQRYARLFHELQ
jgi:hypothetical protein